MKKQWFAIRTHSRKEKFAQENYERQGFQTYLPKVYTVRKHARNVEKVEKPFFPGYMFLNLAPDERQWTTIRSTRGAVGPVCMGDYYPPVPDWVIDELQERENSNGVIPLETLAKSLLKPGSMVEVAFANGLEEKGIFQAFRGADRAVILLDILCRQVQTVVPVASLNAL